MPLKLKVRAEHLLYLAWFLSLGAVAGSLYFSEILKYAPCVLCWYQRICMFPLAVLLGVGFFQNDLRSAFYSLPFAIGGVGLAAYHSLLYYGVISEKLSPCTAEPVSCLEHHLNLFGFISIPLLSFIGFSMILICLLGILWQKEKV